MIQKIKRRALEQGTASKTQLSAESIPQRTFPRKRVTSKAVQAEFAFLLAAKERGQ